MADGNDSTQKASGSFPADRTSDLAGNVNDELVKQSDKEAKKSKKVDVKVDESGPTWATAGNPDLGERLAQEAASKRDNNGGVGDVKFADDGHSVIREDHTDNSDNGKVYSDPRINPRDTNAPDAGLTPDGIRTAK